MSEITLSEVNEISDEKLKGVGNRVFRTFALAAEKAVAHHASPTNFPIPANPDSLEQIFLTRFKELKPEIQQGAVSKVMASVNAPEAQRAQFYGDLAKVHLKSAVEVGAQVKQLPFPESLKFSASHLTDIISVHLNDLPGGHDGIVPHHTLNKLELRIHKVKCLDETDPEWGGDDEIYLGGSTVDETGDTHKVPKFKVGDFDDGKEKGYAPPKQFSWFNLAEGTTFPKSYFATLVLAEVDFGGFGEFLNKLLDKVKGKVTEYILEAIGGSLGTATIPGLGTAIGIAMGWVVGKLVEWLKGWLGDDVFVPITVRADIPELNAHFAGNSTHGPERTVWWKGYGGHYKLWYDWRRFA